MHIFPPYSAKRNLRSPFFRKYLKALANKVCDVMWVWEISTFKNRTLWSSFKETSWLQIAMHLAVGNLGKYPRDQFFIGSLLQMLKANYFDRDGCRTLIVQLPCQKMKSFLFAQIILEKKVLLDLKVGNITFFSLLRESLDDP